MRRRDFIAGVAAGTALSLPKIAKAQSKKIYRAKLVTSFPPKLPVLQEGPELFAKIVEKASGGRLKIKVFAGGELVPSLGVFDAVSQGTIEFGSSAPAYWAGKIPASQIIAGIPFGMNAQQMLAWYTHGGGLEVWREAYKPFRLFPLPLSFMGAQMAGWFHKEINTPADLKGLKFRMPGLAGKVLAKAGVNVVLMPGGELYTALERGTIDGTEWVGPYLDMRLGLHKIVEHYYYPAWHDASGPIELMVNEDFWNSLPEDIQAIVKQTAYYITAWGFSKLEAENGKAIEKIQAERKVKIQKLPDEVLLHLKKLSEEVVSELVASDPMAKKAYASHSSFQKSITEWAKVGEFAYGKMQKEL